VEEGAAAVAVIEQITGISDLPVLGAGLGYRPAFQRDVLLYRSQIDFLEIVADHYMCPGPQKRAELTMLAKNFTLIPHGLNLSLGSADGLNKGYLARMARLIDVIDPPWWSEHIAFTRTKNIEIGHLTPIPYTWEAVDVFCRNVETVREYIDVPLILENITNMLQLPGAEMTEAQFISEILTRTDCGLLLDITNLHTNAVNFGFDPIEFLEQLPLERVVQLHYVGGHRQGDKLIDSHSSDTPPEVWDLMAELLRRNVPVKAAVLERDDNLPTCYDLLGELSGARELGRQFGQWA
jgi:uncharacterized protein